MCKSIANLLRNFVRRGEFITILFPTSDGPPVEAAGVIRFGVVNNYMGSFLHANDIRTLTTGAESLQEQVDLVKTFATKHFLKLNMRM